MKNLEYQQKAVSELVDKTNATKNGADAKATPNGLLLTF